MPLLIDTHAHLNFKDYKDDADVVIRRALDNDVWMIFVGSEYKTSQRGLDLANKYEKGVYSAIGLHPVHLEDQQVASQDKDNSYNFRTRAEEFNYDNYEKLAKFEKVVGIGEIGLDYYHINLADNVAQIKKKQHDVLIKQLKLARILDLPVILHCRLAHDDLVATLREFKRKNKELFKNDKPWGVVHCFSGDEDLAWKYFSLGLIISFTGLITFSKRWDNLIRKLPFEKFMLETDSPYMTPEPHRGNRNEPLLVKQVANRIAEIKSLSLDKVAEITTNNAKNLFRI